MRAVAGGTQSFFVAARALFFHFFFSFPVFAELLGGEPFYQHSEGTAGSPASLSRRVKMRCCRTMHGLGEWSNGLSILSDALTQVIESRGTGKDNVLRAPLRCVVASRSICRGEQLCVVPESHILHGEIADSVLQHATAGGNFTSYAELRRRLATVSGMPHLLSTRDSLLITLALYTLRHGGVNHPLTKWVSSLPPRVPPMGLLLQLQEKRASAFTPLQRRLRAGTRTALISSPLEHADTDVATVELMLQAAESCGIDAVSKPQVEVVATEPLIAAFCRGKRHPLTQRQHEANLAKSRGSLSAAQQQLVQLETSVYSDILTPLQRCMFADNLLPTPPTSTTNQPGDDDAGGDPKTIEQLRWSHFMMRSRAVNLHFIPHRQQQRAQPPKVAVVPFLDMLNHSVRSHNVTYRYRSGIGVVVVASRLIKKGEELTLNYGDFRQRGCLFHEPSCCAGADVIDGSAAMRLIESRQMHEWDNAADSSLDVDHPEDAPFGQGPERQQQRDGKSNLGDQSDYGEEARMEATWLWRFGFPRTEDEKAYVASHLWSKGLRRRVAQLTDVRRRGRPGEFVIGVPEGLQHLREQRERLERERFGGVKVFPPQNA
ncbi:SET domain containing protein, putative [Trypanosoma equiperdum]|uniref:SET domain-containing protein n=3 Tax=Trypanozoon TaxID=39700 RepID=Q382I1_TRYB2|nr:hypothetical protein, conserved [Trypanosoma brucei brucei TREU927]EAN80300.1 hypothetical protein, conserved [Trypanosoma brucei brucei TREU927]SCU66279.1 SET domain containing protein, putative [Trypanosoma equiperdum]